MPSNFAIEVTFEEGTAFTIEQAEDSVDVSLNETETTFSLVAVPGAKGETGTEWWYGDGVPTVVIGSKPNDYYIDNLTGLVYKLM